MRLQLMISVGKLTHMSSDSLTTTQLASYPGHATWVRGYHTTYDMSGQWNCFLGREMP